MASRRLALNLAQGLRSRAALNAVAPLKRGFATPVAKNGVKTETTTLTNGLTVLATITRERELLTLDRLLQNILHGLRRQRLEFGLMLGPGRKQIRPMAQLTSWNTLPSRYALID